MKGFRTLSILPSLISAVSLNASAEVIMLEDTELDDISGQAGITIDVETQWEIGEFAYHDAGYFLIQGMRMGGNSLGNGSGFGGSLLDNLRLEIDIAGDGSANNDNLLAYGFSNMRDIAQIYVDESNVDLNFQNVAAGTDSTRNNLLVDDKKTYGDGDLIIHFDFTDGWATEGGLASYKNSGAFGSEAYDAAEKILEEAVDFRIEIDAIGIGGSNYVVGGEGLDIDSNHDSGLHQGQPGTTTLMSQLGLQGYLGPEDLHLENHGNGFDGSGALGAGTGKADSKIYWSSYFKITDFEVYIDIAGVQIRDVAIFNDRGDLSGLDGTSSFGFAHSVREIYAVNEAVVNATDLITGGKGYVDGIALNTHFKGDIDIGSLSFGDTDASIGSFFTTDFESLANWVVSAH